MKRIMFFNSAVLLAFVFAQDTTSAVADTTELIRVPVQIIAEKDTIADSTQAPLPEFLQDYPPPSTLLTDETFYDYIDDIEFLKSQIDSLKKLIRVYSKKDTMPAVDKSLLDLIKKSKYSHRIMLENGTVVRGDILEKTNEMIVLNTDIGKLVLDRKFIVNIEKELPKTVRIKLTTDPIIKQFADKEIISGMVINTGEKRGDFVRVVANLWGDDTELIAKDSIFVNGSERTYSSGVITDTSVGSGDSASFKIIVTFPADQNVSYRTFDAHWDELE